MSEEEKTKQKDSVQSDGVQPKEIIQDDSLSVTDDQLSDDSNPKDDEQVQDETDVQDDSNATDDSVPQDDKKRVRGNITITEIEPGIVQATSVNSKYIIEYDRNKCIGAASCSVIAEATFAMDDENKAIIREDVPDFDEDEVIMAAAQSCPVFAIKIIDKESGEVLFPIE